MATGKKVEVEARIGEKFKCEAKIRDHVVYIDQPKAAGGEDSGPTPLEYLLFSFAGCVMSIGRIVANQQRIGMRSMQVKVEGELDTETLMGKGRAKRAGFMGIKVIAKLDADMSLEEKTKFLHEVDLRCPLSDNISNATPVSFEVKQ